MVYLKAIQKITSKDIAVLVTIDEETYLKKLRGASAPLAPHWIRLWVQRTGEGSTKHIRYEAQKATDSLQGYDAATTSNQK